MEHVHDYLIIGAGMAADAAAKAAAKLIAERHDAGSDAKLIDQAIGEIGR